MLESIYKEFDAMANKRKVFKVRDNMALIHCPERRLLNVVPLVRSKRSEIATSQWRVFLIRARIMR